jgi:hypothetical protein
VERRLSASNGYGLALGRLGTRLTGAASGGVLPRPPATTTLMDNYVEARQGRLSGRRQIMALDSRGEPARADRGPLDRAE